MFYNVCILKRLNTELNKLSAALIFAAVLFVSPAASAQSTLQPSTGSLQPQTGQAQSTTNQLNQTGGVQANTGNQSFLNQSTLRPLGVVSDPRQTTPDVVATPSTNLRTEVNSTEGTNWLPFIALGSLAVVIIGVIYLWRAERKPEPELVPAGEILIQPEPQPAKKRKKKARKKGRKPNQR